MFVITSLLAITLESSNARRQLLYLTTANRESMLPKTITNDLKTVYAGFMVIRPEGEIFSSKFRWELLNRVCFCLAFCGSLMLFSWCLQACDDLWVFFVH